MSMKRGTPINTLSLAIILAILTWVVSLNMAHATSMFDDPVPTGEPTPVPLTGPYGQPWAEGYDVPPPSYHNPGRIRCTPENMDSIRRFGGLCPGDVGYPKPGEEYVPPGDPGYPTPDEVGLPSAPRQPSAARPNRTNHIIMRHSGKRQKDPPGCPEVCE